MSFLSPFAVPGHEAPYRPRGGEDALAQAIDGDPRRLIAIVGAPGAGSSRLAIEMAKRASMGFVLQEEGEPEALAERLRGVTGRPILVLDGERALRLVGRFVEREIHPRLAVVVPVDEASAPRLPLLSGLARASVALVTIDSKGEQRPRGSDFESELLASQGEPEEAVLQRFLATDDPALLDAARFFERAIPVSRRVLDGMAARAEVLLDEAEGERAAALLELLARDAGRRGEDARDRLFAALERTRSNERRARILVALGVIERSDARFAEALTLTADRAPIFARWSRVLELDDRTDDAITRAEGWLAAEEARGSRLGASRARMRLSNLLRGREDRAIAVALSARDDARAIGDSGGEARALHLLATLLLDQERFDDALAYAREALALAEAIGDAATIGWARFVLGAAADRHADPAAARAHYEAGIAALREAGMPIPTRLHGALATARAALGHAAAEPSPDLAPDVASDLVQLGRRPR